MSALRSSGGNNLRPSLSVGARQITAMGPAASSGLPAASHSRMRPLPRSSAMRNPSPDTVTLVASLATCGAEGAGAARRAAGRALARPVCFAARANCSQATSWPLGAQGSGRAVTKRNVRNASSPSRASGASRETVTSCASPGSAASRGNRPRLTTRPSMLSSQEPASQESPAKCCLLRMRNRPEAPAGRPRASTATGCISFLASNMAGWGVRSGHTRPSATKLRSFGSSPKSPP